MNDPVRPLQGIRVLDLSRVIAGPYAGRLLSDLGADVVKVEPPDGDLTRIWGEERHGVSGFFQQHNAGKRDVGIDLGVAGGRDLVVRLAAVSHVVIENFRAGVADRLGIGWRDLSAANPSLVMLSVSGFGLGGPDSDRPAYAPVLQADAGFVRRQTSWDAGLADPTMAPVVDYRPIDPMLSISDSFSAMHGTIAVLAAIRHAERTGVGNHIDMSMLDATLATDDYIHHAIDGSEVKRLGGEYWPAPLPEDVDPTTDDGLGRWLLVSAAFPHMFRRLCDVHGLVDPAPRNADLATKVRLRRAAAHDWFSSFTVRALLIAALEKCGFAWGELRTPEGALASPTAVHREVVAQVDDRGGNGGTRGVIQTPYRFSNVASGVRAGAPHRGEHNAEILAEWLGMDAAGAEALAESGVLHTSVP